MAGEIASLQTDSQDVAMIVAAHNAAREAVAEDRDRSGTSEGYAAHFARIYQAIRAAIEADRQPSEPAPDPRLDAGT